MIVLVAVGCCVVCSVLISGIIYFKLSSSSSNNKESNFATESSLSNNDISMKSVAGKNNFLFQAF